MKARVLVLALAFVALTGTAWAETAYITDQIYVSLRPGQNNDDPPIKTVRSGTALEVLQRANGFVQVRDASGVEGWVADRYLTSDPPAKLKLDALNKQVDDLRQQLAQAQVGQKQAEAAAAGAKAELTQQPPQPAAPPPAASSPGIEFFSLIWLAVAFAMLVIGFVAGVIWLREVNRKKLGGMHLRI